MFKALYQKPMDAVPWSLEQDSHLDGTSGEGQRVLNPPCGTDLAWAVLWDPWSCCALGTPVPVSPWHWEQHRLCLRTSHNESI